MHCQIELMLVDSVETSKIHQIESFYKLCRKKHLFLPFFYFIRCLISDLMSTFQILCMDAMKSIYKSLELRPLKW